MTDTTRPGDPADRAADGAFGGVTPHATHSHRAGYGDDRLERLIAYLRLHPTATLASGEGGMLVQHILLLRARIEGMSEGAKVYEDHYADARAEIDRLRAAIERVRALHKPDDYCGAGCPKWGCPTLRALDGEDA